MDRACKARMHPMTTVDKSHLSSERMLNDEAGPIVGLITAAS